MLKAHASEILDATISTIVELGAGSGDKLAALLTAGGSHHCGVNVHLVDVSRSALRQALANAREVGITSHERTYEVGLEQFAATRSRVGRSLLLFLGSNIGNFDPPARQAFMGAVRTALRPGDSLVLGVDLVKPEAQLLIAYDDPLGSPQLQPESARANQSRTARELRPGRLRPSRCLEPVAIAHRNAP